MFLDELMWESATVTGVPRSGDKNVQEPRREFWSTGFEYGGSRAPWPQSSSAADAFHELDLAQVLQTDGVLAPSSWISQRLPVSTSLAVHQG